MKLYQERTYRKRVTAHDLASFNVRIKETDLLVSSDRDLYKETIDLVFDYRHQLESYIKSHPEFLTTLQPYPDDPYATSIIKDMIASTRDIGVGPMASVAGAIAQHVGLGLLGSAEQVVVENGGDIFLKVNRPVTVSILAGESPLSGRIGISIPARMMPIGVCSSSGRVGHSLSMGHTDVTTILSPSAVRADGAATALGNRIRTKTDLERFAEWVADIEGILGGIVIMGDNMATWGEVELVKL
ncbi:MAG TPA: UPF0280 family protein [Desulfatiglandales bacterium]|nr:UPF0280 family protein [Desulfatiglandales bacterium]